MEEEGSKGEKKKLGKRKGTKKQRVAASRRIRHSKALQMLSCGNEDTYVSTSMPVCSGGSSNLLVSVRPRRGRILVFPHVAPHEGRPVLLGSTSEPTNSKLLLRGEVF